MSNKILNDEPRSIGIMYKPDMARANIEERKWMTRRLRGLQLINADPDRWHLWQPSISEASGEWAFSTNALQGEKGEVVRIRCPYGRAGDRMWQREGCWERPHRTRRMLREGADTWPPYLYDADGLEAVREDLARWGFKRRTALYMPRSACRFERPITRIRCERIQSIAFDDCCIECGAPLQWTGDGPEPYKRNMRASFQTRWLEINDRESWSKNFWVWVIEYKARPM